VALPRRDPLKPSREREEFPSRGIRTPKIAEDFAVPTHALGAHTGSPGDIGAAGLTHSHTPQNNYMATAAPGVNDDTNSGYEPGSEWVDQMTDKAYVCLDATEGAAVWVETTQTAAGAAHDHTTAGDGGVLTGDAHDGYSAYTEIAAPGVAGANVLRLYSVDTGGVTALGLSNSAQEVIVKLADWVDLTDGGASTLHSHAGGGAHVILDSAVHTDTLTGTVVDGDIIIGNATPKWSKLAASIPGIEQRNVLGIDNTELRPSWKTLLSTSLPLDIGTIADSGEGLPAAREDHVHVHPILAGDLHTNYQKVSEKGAASGYAALTAGSKLVLSNMQEVMAHADLSDDGTYSINTTGGAVFGAAGVGSSGGADFEGSGSFGAGLLVTGLLELSGPLAFSATATETIDANDEITPSSVSPIIYLTSAGASDNLVGITAAAQYQFLILRPAAGKDITLVHDGVVTAGKPLKISGSANYVMANDFDFALATYNVNTLSWDVMVPSVTLAGAGSFLSVSGRTITQDLIDLTTDVTGDLPYANLTPATAASKLLGRGSAAGAGDWEEITLGTNLSMSGTTLNASGGGAVASDIIWDAKGDLAVGTGADTAVKITAGADNAVLQTLASEATGLIWRTTPRIGAIADTGGTTRIELTAAADNIVLTGEVRITAAAAAATSQALDLSYTMTTAQTNHMGIRISPQLTLTGTASLARGLYGQAVVSGPTAGTGTSLQGWGLDYNFVAQEIFSSVTNTWLTVGGIQASGLAQALGASSVVNVTNFHGLKTYLQLNALISGTVAVTNAYGVWVAAPINTSGTITTNKGVYVENLGGTGTTNVFGVDIAAQSGASAINVGLRNAGTTVFTPSTVQTLAAGTTILANATYIMINSSGAVTLTNNPVIADGQDGQILIIHNVDSADAITIPENNVQFAPTGSKVLGPGDSVTLIFSATLGDWYEIASANV